MDKPADLFDRAWEWGRLTSLASDAAERPLLGVVTGRRRQGKSVLVRALCEAAGGFYWEAFEGSRADQLADLAARLARHTGAAAPFAFPDWDTALGALAGLARDRASVIALDELPYAMHESRELPSLLQRQLGSDRSNRARWILCGSALRVMGGLLAGDAPLRGRASMELVVLPFDFRTAREFWGIEDLDLALRVFAIAGGTPAYAREFVRDDAPHGSRDFDAWVCRTVLDPSVPLFREGRILVSEEESLSDRALYHAVLAAIAAGENAPARIASRLERPVTSLGHPLGMLMDTGLVTKHTDAFHARRATYEIAEPLLRFHHAVLRPNWSVLERPGRQAAVWAAARATFAARVVGPVFEEVARTWTLRFSERIGAVVASVGRGVVNDAKGRSQHDLDVVAHDSTGRIVAIGEAKWGRRLGSADADRLRHIRGLLVAAGHDAASARLLLFSGGGEHSDLGPDVTIVDLATLYGAEGVAAG